MPVTLAGPALPDHAYLGFCAICSAAWKARAFEDQSGDVTAADKSPDPVKITLYARGLPVPAPAVTMAVVTLPAPPGSPAAGAPLVVPMPVCWTHAQAVQFLAGSIIPANAHQLPSGGIPLDRPH
jgi:hypothetical protein